MKKRIVVSVCMAVLLCGLLCACSTKLVKNVKLSELRSNIFIGSDNDYRVVAVTGIRENPFEIDGHSQSEKAYFTIITITPQSYVVADHFFKVSIGGTEYEGKMSRHPFNQTYSAEISAQTESDAISVTIKLGEKQSVITANSVINDNFITGQKAFEIAEKKLKQSIEAKKDKDYEIFVRLIENPINSSGGYFWYVAFVFEDKITLAVLIEPVTMEIVAIKN